MKDEIQESNERALAVVRENEKLIAKAREVLGNQDRMLQEAGIDPGKYRKWLDAQMTPAVRAQARAEFENEMNEIRHEAEAQARLMDPRKTVRRPRRPTV